MFLVKVNVAPGEDKLYDLSSCVDEKITTYDLMNVVGKYGLEKELRHKIDLFQSRRAYEDDMNADLTGPFDARIYIDDRLDMGSAVFVNFNDKDLAMLLGEPMSDIAGSIALAAKFFYETFTDDIDDGAITLCDVMDGVLVAVYFKTAGKEYDFVDFTATWKRLRSLRINGLNILDMQEPLEVLELVCR